jgi:hypothetical protein
MDAILNSPEAQRARGEVPEGDEVEEALAPEPEEDEQPDDDAEGDADAEGDGDEGEEDQPLEDDEEEAEEEPEVQAEGDYGPFASAEELARGYKETRSFAQEQSRARAQLERELQEARELLAYQAGTAEVRQGPSASPQSEEFQEWAADTIESDPARGMAEVQAYAEETGDWSYAVAYTDIWGEDDPYQAGRARNFVDMAIALGRGGQPQEDQTALSGANGYDRESSANTISAAYHTLRQHYTDLAEGSPVLAGVVAAIQSDQRLHTMVRSGDIEEVTWAIEMARERHLASVPRDRRPRASRADRDRLAAEKAATRMPEGDGARVNGRRADAAAVPPEFQGAMNQFAKWGMVREE